MTEEHQCVICQRRPYMRAQVCDACRDRLPRTIAEIVELWKQLPDAMPRDQSNGQRVTGSREAPVPLNVDALDLALPARVPEASAEGRKHPEDQVGHPAVASILDQWCRDWRDEMAFAQSLPVPTVPELARFLINRCDWAADRHPAVDEFASEMGRLRAVLRGVLGLIEPPAEFCDGVVCRKCDRYALYRESDYVECDHCGLLYSESEYEEWAALIAGQVRCPVCDARVAKAVRGRAARGDDVEPITYYPCGDTIEVGLLAGQARRMAA